MEANLIEVAKQCPSLNITISAGELMEAINYCVQFTRNELEQQITDANAETYPSVEQVCKTLEVSKPTLWRWKKAGYLVPVTIGGKVRYKMSDVKRILEGGER